MESIHVSLIHRIANDFTLFSVAFWHLCLQSFAIVYRATGLILWYLCFIIVVVSIIAFNIARTGLYLTKWAVLKLISANLYQDEPFSDRFFTYVLALLTFWSVVEITRKQWKAVTKAPASKPASVPAATPSFTPPCIERSIEAETPVTQTQRLSPAPEYRPRGKDSSYFFRSFDRSEYQRFLQTLDDHDLSREAETILADLGVNAGAAALHWSHAAATAGLTAPLSVAGTCVSMRKGYVKKRKYELLKRELEERAMSVEFGSRGLLRLVKGSARSIATLGIHPDS